MSKIAAKRRNQLDALISSAESRIAKGGLAALRARDLAADAGIALGAIYNLVADLDELILHVGSRTLARLDQVLASAGAQLPLRTAEQAAERLVTLAMAYAGFAGENPRLWRALFEHRMPADKPFPDWATQDQLRLMRHVDAPLAVVMPRARAAERSMLARTLFSAAHGVVSLGLDDKLVAVPAQELARQLRAFISAACRGLAEADLRGEIV